MKADKTTKNQQENDAYLLWARPVLKKGGLAAETLKLKTGSMADGHNKNDGS